MLRDTAEAWGGVTSLGPSVVPPGHSLFSLFKNGSPHICFALLLSKDLDGPSNNRHGVNKSPGECLMHNVATPEANEFKVRERLPQVMDIFHSIVGDPESIRCDEAKSRICVEWDSAGWAITFHPLSRFRFCHFRSRQ